MRIQVLGGAAARRVADRVWPVYDEVFGDWEAPGPWREQMFLRHTTRDAYRLILAESASGLVGFAWGYRGERGQFWSDWVARELPNVAEAWIGGHDELVSIGVLSSARGEGLGGRLVDAFLAGAGPRTLLSTETDRSSAAVRLYRSRGFEPLGRLALDVQVMGRRSD